MKIFIAKQLLKIINWTLGVLFTEKEIEILETDFRKELSNGEIKQRYKY